MGGHHIWKWQPALQNADFQIHFQLYLMHFPAQMQMNVLWVLYKYSLI